VLREGHIAAGDTVAVIPTDRSAIGVTEVVTLYTKKGANGELLQRALATAALPDSWRDYFQARR
jgi:MOSC domain-containing protein YiiM